MLGKGITAPIHVGACQRNLFSGCVDFDLFPALLHEVYFYVHICNLISFPKYIYSPLPCRWIIDPPLDITVPAKRTPWPDAPPELPTSTEKVTTPIPENTEKRPTKSGSKRKRSSRSKRKHTAKVLDERASAKHAGEN